ncbi:type VII secretion protein EssC [Paenibacillus sp. F411]|uniref:type VII secretion protein EssC n=1 Tax=Paenibacillus sp. F411 TaxID=2820239 RepID=UPI001AAE5206|nr:type VII secretion protein EssC [Paenibacillus sp. F411]MBO2944181.1 type VII secretion protein EssC [Paenibacillus sp. F411]
MNVLYQRSPRIKPALQQEDMEIFRPPTEPSKPSFSMISIIIPVIMTALMIAFYVYMNMSGRMGSGGFMMFQMIMIPMMLMSYTLPFFMYLSNKKVYRKRLEERDRMYRAQLELHREELKERQREQVETMFEIHGDPEVCSQIVKSRSSRLWERSVEDSDFLELRAGKGQVPFFVHIKPPRSDGYEKDPLIEAAEVLAADFAVVEDASITLPLNQSKVIGVVGQREHALNALRVLVAQMTVRHSPDEVKLAAFYEEKEADEWDWMRWFPHCWDDDRSARYLADRRSTAHQLADELFMQLNRRRRSGSDYAARSMNIPAYMILLSSAQLIEEEPLLPLLMEEAEAVDAITIVLSDRKESLPMQCQLILEAGKDRAVVTVKEDGKARQQGFDIDHVSRDQMEALARYMAPIRLKRSSASDIPSTLTLFEMMEIETIEELDLHRRWQQNRYPDSLPVAMGVRAGSKRINLNLHDKIERGGHGPHGLIAGTTGSGKSEVIQSIVASLAAEFHPHDLAFMLIDYKGGGMSNTFLHLPHVVGTITNLDNNLIERAKVSLKAELVRRQKLLNDAGNLQHIDEYYKLLRSGQGVPLPHLVIIIDEFAQLKKDQPEFMDELISIAAIGRTLGVHLILATQKPAGVVDDKIWSNSRFRICLRVQSEGDSRDMLKIPNAAWINKPGRGYFQVGSDEVFEEMQFAWSGAPYTVHQDDQDAAVQIRELRLNGKYEPMLAPSQASKVHQEEPMKQLQVFINQAAEAASAHGISRLPGPWLPPLPETLELEEVEALTAQEDQLASAGSLPLTASAGLVDDLTQQCQRPLLLNLEQGHWVIYGMPGLGKTTLIQTMLMSLAAQYQPDQWHGYIVDMGRTMRDFAGLPHIGAVMTTEEDDRIKRLFRFLARTAATRKELMAEAGVKTASSYRRSMSSALPQLIVVIDGYLNFRNTYADENDMLEYLLREGGSLGITFIISANRISDIFEKVRSNISHALSFELADPSDYYYAVGRPTKAPSQLPPGRGLVKGQVPPLEFQSALPAPGRDEGERSAALRKQIQQLSHSWSGEKAPAILSLPEKIQLHELLDMDQPYSQAAHQASRQVTLGLTTDDLDPFNLSLEEGPHFIIGSPMEGGKTSFMLSWMLSMALHSSPEELELYTVDTRYGSQGLASLSQLPHVKGTASDEEELTALISKIYEAVQLRTKEEEHRPIVLMIDDADVLSKQLNDFTVKDQLSSIVRLGRDRNVHVIISGVPADFPTYGVDWFSDIKAAQAGFLFGTLDSNDLSFFRIPFSESNHSAGGLKLLPPGQGYYIKRKFSRIKGAVPFTEVWNPEKWVKEIRDRWHVVV